MRKIIAFSYSIVIYVMFLGTFFYAIGFVGNFIVPKSIDSGTEQGLGMSLLVNALLVGLFAIQHSVMARPAFKIVWTKIVPKTIERSTYVLATNFCLILLYWKWIPMKGIIWEIQSPLFTNIIWAIFTTGCLIILASTFTINHFDLIGLKQTFNPLMSKEAPTLEFKTTWFYKFCRHPIMFGFMIAMVATPVMTLGHLFFAVMCITYIFIALIFEERDLLNAIGEPYKEYQRTVPKICPFSFGRK